jgi:hypothetical protein
MSGSNTTGFELPTGAFDFSISKQAVFAGAILGILVNMSVFLVPLLRYVGGGLVAGFVAAYIIGGPRGWFHGIIAGVITGLVAGSTVAVMGGLLSLFIEPPMLIVDLLGSGIVSTLFSGMGIIGTLLIILTVAAFVTVDSIIGGAIGGLLRTSIDITFRN